MSYQFQRWIITLEAQVRALHESIAHEDSEKLRKEIQLYEAELQQLYAYAKQQDIDLIKYHQPFSEIEKYLLLLHKGLVLKRVNTK